MRHRAHHLHDEQLFDCYITERGGDAIDPPSAEHLADCNACSARYAELAQFMDTLRREGDADADAVFTPERLRAQQQQIARRIEQVGRPARVISRCESSRVNGLTANSQNPTSQTHWKR